MKHKIIHANGLDFAYLDAGTGDKLVLCLHGFPDTAHTWDDLLPKLGHAGFHAVAPFMRGYPPTEIPADGQYTSKHLGEDIIALLDAFGAETALIVGHDWGALASYAATALAPQRFTKLVTVAIPHPRALRFDFSTLIKARHFITFQQKKSSVQWMKRDNFQALTTIFKRWSPNWQFSDADIQPIRDSLAQDGAVEGALGYYWSFWESRNDKNIQRVNRRKTEIPTLSIFGTADGALTLSALERTSSAFLADYQQVVLPNVGHFLHREVPDTFADLVLNFLLDSE